MTRRAGRLAAAAAVVLLAAPLLAGGALAVSDPYVGTGENQQWHLSRIRAQEAWATTRGSGAIVAVIDTGVRLTHEDLVGRILRDGSGNVVGRDYVDNDASPDDEQGHGTLVAGVVAATEGNGLGGAGVGPLVRIMPIRVLDEEGGGDASDVDAAIRWAADNGADVINLSLECARGGRVPVLNPVACTTLGGAPEAAVDYAASRGAVVVAAAGNDGSGFTDYSSDSPVLLVGATDRDDNISSFSDRGRDDVVMAPGEEIVSTWCSTDNNSPCDRDDTYGKANGTSFSAPQVSAAIAMLMSRGLTGPDAVARVRATARDLGSPGPDSTYGHGLLDVAAAVGSDPTPAPEPTTPAPEPTTPAAQPTTPSQDPTTPPRDPEPDPTQAPTPTISPGDTPTPTPSSPTTTPSERSPSPTDNDGSVTIGSVDESPDRRPAWTGLGLLALTVAAHVAARRLDYGA